MNRPPSSKDSWWSNHQATCGGTYVKIKEPDDYKKKGKITDGENSKTSQGKTADIKKLLEKNCSDEANSSIKQSLQKTNSGFSGTGYILGGIKQEKQFSRPSEAAAFAVQKRHSQTNNSPASKRMKEITSKGKEGHKEIVKVDKSCVSKSKMTTVTKDVKDLSSNETKYSKRTSNSVTNSGPCSSSSVILQEQDDGEVIDLTSDNDACPICGFTSTRTDQLTTHINECLIEFVS